MKKIVTICARGGSKGVKNKNTTLIEGIPLIVYTLRQAKAVGIFEGFAVSSDSAQILELAEQEGFLPIRRSEDMASDSAPKIPVIRQCVQSAEQIYGHEFDICFDLDCTSPLRSLKDITDVEAKIEKENVSNVITAMPARRSPYFNLVELNERGEVNLAKSLLKPIVRRQDAPACFDMNASIYAWKRHVLMNNDKLFLPQTALHIMPEERSIDIDSELDLAIVEMLIKRGR